MKRLVAAATLALASPVSLVFETDGNAVTMFRAGAASSAEYVEGCL